jgi:hypothetical protein
MKYELELQAAARTIRTMPAANAADPLAAAPRGLSLRLGRSKTSASITIPRLEMKTVGRAEQQA